MKLKLYAIFFGTLLLSGFASAQTSGDYRSKATGNWQSASNWEVFNSGAWATATVFPTSASGNIYISRNHTITLASGTLDVDQLTVTGGGTLNVANGANFNLVNGNGTDLIVESNVNVAINGTGIGSVYVYGTLVSKPQTQNFKGSNSIVSFESGSSYYYSYQSDLTSGRNVVEGDAIHASYFDVNSTYYVNALTNAIKKINHLNTGQRVSLGNLVWNTPNYNAGDFSYDLDGGLPTIEGDFTIINTGAKYLSLDASVNGTTNVSITGSLIVENNAKLEIFYLGGTSSLTIGNDFIINSSFPVFANTETSATINVGNLIINSGELDLLSDDGGSPIAGTTDLNILGDFTLNGGTLTNTLAGIVSINFIGDTQQQLFIDSDATLTTNADYTVASNAIVQFVGETALTGTGGFTTEDFATLQFQSASTNGAVAQAIQLGGLLDYGQPTYITYNGTSGKQYISNGLPPTADVFRLTIDNADGVELLDDLTLGVDGSSNYELVLTEGDLLVGNQTLTLYSDIIAGSGAINTTSASNLILGFDGSLSNFPFASANPVVGNLTLDGTGLEVTLNSPLTVTNTLLLANGVLRVDDETLILNDDISILNGSLSTNETSRLIVNGTGALTIGFANGSELSYLELNRQAGSGGEFDFVVTLNSDLTITDTLNNLSGTLADNGNILSLADQALYRTSNLNPLVAQINAIGQYSILYYSDVENIAFATENELPTGSSELNNLEIDVNGSVDFIGQNFTVNGNFIISRGLAKIGDANINIENGLIVNDSIFGNSASTITFTGNSTFISGSANFAQLDNVVIEEFNALAVNIDTLQVIGSWTNNGNVTMDNTVLQFNAESDQVIAPGNGQFFTVILSGVAGGTPYRRTITEDFDVDGSLILEDNVELEISTNNLFVAGDFVSETGTLINSETSVINFDGGAQNITSGNFAFGQLTLSGAGTKTLLDSLTVQGNIILNAALDVGSDNSVTVLGDWINNSLFNAADGTVYLAGSGNQTISGSQATNFVNLQVATSAINQGVINLTGLLTLNADATFSANGSGAGVTVLQSTSSESTAAIGPLLGSAAVTGDFVVERFMDNQGASFRYIATPVTTATVSDISDDDILVDYTYVYNETTPGEKNIGWELHTAGSIAAGTGFASYIPYTEGNNAIMDVTGPVGQGTINFAVSYTNDTNSEEDGWNLLGNPYPAPINWNNMYDGSNNIDATVYVSDNSTGSTTFISYNGGVQGLPVPNGDLSSVGNIASGQAFWVRSNGNGAALSVEETDKATDTSVPFYRKSNKILVEDAFKVVLSRGQLRDETVVAFRTNATEQFDKGMDGYKYMNGGKMFSLSTLSAEGSSLVYNILGDVACGYTIPLLITNAGNGNYALSFKHLDSFTKTTSLKLIDKYKNELIDISPETNYSFTVDQNEEDSNTKPDNRFELLVQGAMPKIALNQDDKRLYVSGIAGPYQWFVDGEPIKNATDDNFMPSVNGSYTVVSTASGCQLTSMPYINSDVVDEYISMWPNPTNGNLTYVYRYDAQEVTVNVFSISGQLMQTSVDFNYPNKKIKLDITNLPSGIYIIELSDPNYSQKFRIIRN